MPLAPLRAILIASAFLPTMTFAANYQAQTSQQDGIDIVRLTDTAHHTEVLIVPSFGNNAYSMKVNGHEILYLPARSLTDWKAKPDFGGVPFLWPWANRVDGMAYWANGKKYLLNPDLGNLRYDPNQLPIHGLLAYSDLWHASDIKADAHSAHVTSQLDFWKYPDLMAQFPFPHTLRVTYRLHDGILDVTTNIQNAGMSPMPVALGFHPYFQLDDSPRDQWTAHLAAHQHLVLNDKLIPTGEMKPMDLPDPYPLAGHQLDDGFTDLVKDSTGNVDFWVHGKNQQITVRYGPKFPVAVAYAPPGKSFICFEPMASLTDGYNLAHDGKWNGLQSIPPGATWEETFQIRPSGF
ncbi:aldose 1-epimerase [Nevskia soli]|uniref:aldose 1-epimerase n=1 Tax=Nevskia soli TaxID=418856 RepID=UPI0015D84DA1|nr:aldose 1-epimerase [Nevskia soli]